MTEQEFLTVYHEYKTHSASAAATEAVYVNLKAEGFQVEAVNMDPLGWCLILKVAADEARSMNKMTNLDEQAAQATISERLRSIDKGAWGQIENPYGIEYHMDIGLLVHQAADEIKRLKEIMAGLGKQYTPKLDADDQEQLAQTGAAKIKAVLDTPKPTPKWIQSPSEIASEIAGEFYPVASLPHADLRRQIIKAIEAEREVAKHYMTQMGRWWERLGS